MPEAKHVVIIGGGFCGAITAVNLIRDADVPLKITIVNSGAPFIRGVAYSAYSDTHLLNVIAGNMSAFLDDKEHFVNWLLAHNKYSQYGKDLLENTFIPRNVYGEYLCDIWEDALVTKKAGVEVTVIDDFVLDLEIGKPGSVKVILQTGVPFFADYVVLATGNSLPRNPPIANMGYYSGATYFRNPWSINSVSNLKSGGDVLIIGNGLTMVDTVVGLMEHGFKNKIYSISGNGFGTLPYRHWGIKYDALPADIQHSFELRKLFSLIKKHIKQVRKLGISAGPVIDSLRPYSQQIWQAFTLEERKLFLSRFRYMWGVARHRLPVFIYDIIDKLRIEGQLEIHRGKLVDIIQQGDEVAVTFYNARKRCEETHHFQRVINCTGPETSIRQAMNPLLRNLVQKNSISPDTLELGIDADVSTYHILNTAGGRNPVLFTLGTNLKGLLWETIAVPELRIQCRQLSAILLADIKKIK